MSIPKEPRQLMINIMYLVLTAMLALNVSAEIFNAFKMVDNGLISANESMDAKNNSAVFAIEKGSKKKAEFASFPDKAKQAQTLTKELVDYLNGIKAYLVDQGGDQNGVDDEGDYDQYGIMKALKKYDVTTRYLVGVDGKQGEGEVLMNKIIDYKEKYLALIPESLHDEFASKMPLNIDNESWKNSITPRNNWADFTFNHMPVGAVLPIFTKFINDAKSSEAAVLNYMVGVVGGDDVVLDKFQVFSSPKKAYIIQGEPYETEISLGASAGKSSKTGIQIKVNGTNMKVNENGGASYRTVPGTVGIKKYKASVTVSNPVTGEVQTFDKTFEYEVGLRSCNVSATKMNVFYIGVPNPVTVSAAGVSSNALNVQASGVTMSKKSGNDYTVTASRPGKATITVSGGGLQATKFEFRVKRIPDPVAQLGKVNGGTMGNGTFKAQPGVIAALKNFDFEARCNIGGFRIVRIAKRQDPEIAINRGGRYSGEAKSLVSKAKPGDKFFFENIKAKCPGDKAARPLSGMIFNIK